MLRTTSGVEKRHDIATGTNEIDRNARQLEIEQRALTDNQAKLAADQRQLGSAQMALATAQEQFAAAVKVRLAKLDTALARLASATDVASVDATAGFHARRELLAARIAAMPSAAADTWPDYTRDIDTTFDAIERDLHARP